MEQHIQRGTNVREIIETVRNGSREPAKMGRELCRYDFKYNAISGKVKNTLSS